MAKITALPPLGVVDGTETVPVVKDGETRRAAIGPLANAAVAPAVAQASAASATSVAAATRSESARDVIVAAIADDSFPHHLTFAAMMAAIAAIAEGDTVQVLEDETLGGAREYYRKVGGAMVHLPVNGRARQLTLTPPLLPSATSGTARYALFVPPPVANASPYDVSVSLVVQRTWWPDWAEPNTVLSLGTNQNLSFLPANNLVGSGSFRIEGNWLQAGFKISEFHISAFDRDGGELRMFSAIVPHNRADFALYGYTRYAAGLHVFDDHESDARIQFNFRVGVEQRSNVKGGHVYTVFGTNNRQVAQQMNAAGTVLTPLPFLNDFTNLLVQQPIYLVAAVTQTPASVRGLFVANATEVQANDSLISIGAPAVTGELFALTVNGGPTQRLTSQIYNNNNGATNLDLQILNGPNADAFLSFSNVAGGAVWTLGYDNSDGDKIKLEASYRSLGDNSMLFWEADPAAGVTRFGKPLRKPVYTVGTLPSAAIVGAGAEAYVSDANAPVAHEAVAGGGAAFRPVYSNGSAWRAA